jgi:hypothetical protein
MTASPAAQFIYDPSADEVASTALADLQFLCEQRFAALHSPEFGEDVLTAFDHRIEAYLDVLQSRGPEIIQWLQGKLADAAEPGEVCGIALALLQSGDARALDALLMVLGTAEEEPKLRGLNMALRHRSIEPLAATLQSWLASGTPRQAAHAADLLAFHGKLTDNSERLNRLCVDPDPLVRRAAWRAVALSD